jgi:hypothetical protein
MSWRRIQIYTKMCEGYAPLLEMMGIVVRNQNSYVARDMRTGAVVPPGLEPSVFVAKLRVHAQHDYGTGASTTSAYIACNRTLDANDVMVGEWCLGNEKARSERYRRSRISNELGGAD